MELLKELYNSIYANFFGFGTALTVVFTFLMGAFMLFLPGRSKSTGRMGIAALLFSLFNTFYIISSVVYHPLAAFHRWGTVALILPLLIYFVQWSFHYPNDEYPKTRKAFLWVQWIIAIIVTIIFAVMTYDAPKKFHFTGHYWDFDSESVSKYIGIVIQMYIASFAFVGIFKAWKIKTKERWAILKITIGFTLSTGIPSTLNTLSRDGVMDRADYMTSFVLLVILGLFYIILVYFNSTHDRTTFMAKIVGISLVTFLILMQGLSFFTMKDREYDYDTIRKEFMGRALEGGEKNSDIQFILEYSQPNQEMKKLDYKPTANLDLPLMQIDLMNSIIYERIQNIPEENFKEETIQLLEHSHEEFEGYKKTLIAHLNSAKSSSKIETKKEFINKMNKLNKAAFIHSNKLSSISPDKFCNDSIQYLNKIKDVVSFKETVLKKFTDCSWNGQKIEVAELRHNIYKYFRFLKPAGERQYRKSIDGYSHYVSFTKFYPLENKIKEVGFSYLEYRKYMHDSAKEQIVILFVMIFAMSIIFPYFFQGSLVQPLNKLLDGVKKVNDGDLTVTVAIQVNDEIGFLSNSFNKMVHSIQDAHHKLEDYANNLEHKVAERTKEVQERMNEVHKLKVQQDGDYFLTSLLAKPLFYNANKSHQVRTEFIIKQKKQFQFRNKHADLGGDICITGNLKFGTPDNFKRYTMVMNGDAMGKSMQGAGGSLVMGVVMNSIMARSAANKKIIDVSPKKWLTDLYTEVNSVFMTFNGTMVLSATVALIEDDTGKMHYWNAEHPFSVLYRDGKAEFIEPDLRLRKLGLESEYEFDVYEFQLLPDDVLLLASDGRDDLDLTPHSEIRSINDDEFLFLSIVEQARADITEIERILRMKGEITDDLSILKVNYLPIEAEDKINGLNTTLRQINDIPSTINKLYLDGKNLYINGDLLAAKEKIEEAYLLGNTLPRLNRLYGLLCFKTKEYEKASELISSYLKMEEGEEEIWYYLSISEKKLARYENAANAAQRAYNLEPNSLNSLLNLADIYRLMGKNELSKELTEKAMEIDPENKNARKLLSLLTE